MSRGKVILLVLVLVVAGAGAYLFLSKNPKIEGMEQAAEAAVEGGATSETAPAAGTSDTEAPAAKPSDVAAKPGEFWTKRCNTKDTSYCEIFQRLIIKENNKRLIEFAVGYPEGGTSAQAVIVLPLGVVVAEGIMIKVDDGTPSKAMVRTCNADGCYIVMNLPPAFIDTMKTGKKITVGFLDGSAKQVNVELSLEGFGEKLKEVTK